MKYMIHTCNERRWYVDRFLVPSMLAQGIQIKDMCIWQDTNKLGNLESFISSCESTFIIDNPDEFTWHLQDDVAICSTFKRDTERLQEPFICAFVCKYDGGNPPGKGPAKDFMWYSFPCIKFSNKLAMEFAKWARDNIQDLFFKVWVDKKKGDDYVFQIFMEEKHPTMEVLNLAPNLVDHIDYLLGGSTVNRQRGTEIIRSIYWEEPDLIKELERKVLKDRVVQ